MAQGDRQGAALALLLLLAACTTTSSGPGVWDDAPTKELETVGWLGDQAVTYGEIGRYIRVREPDVFSRNLNRYLLERVTLEEAGPLGVAVPEPVVTRETSRRMRAWEQRIRSGSKAQTGQEIDPALWLQRVADLSLADFRARVREAAQIELIQDRLLRYELLTSPSVDVSILLVEGRELARRLADDLRGGTDFEAAAKQHSVHPSGPKGGRIGYPLLPADVGEPRVREDVFRAPAGAILGPYAVSGGQLFEIYRVETRREARKGSYADLERDIARDLEARPVPVGEYVRWRRRILMRHGFRAEAAPGEAG